jgi:hypothetical protein
MLKFFTSRFISFKRSRRLFAISATLVALVVSVVLFGYSSGAGASGLELTGAPFDNGTCANCHGGGNFGAAITLQLLDGNTAVTQYEPGKSYTYRITMTNTVGAPQYGFQSTVATQNNNSNINSWGTLPPNTQNSVSSGRNYVEHSQRLTTSTINVPWTGPAAGTGAIVFYSVVNFVNRNFSTSGDQVINSNLAIAENTNLPVSLLYFRGVVRNGKALLTWAAATETDSKHYTIEKSTNGTSFKPIAEVASKNRNNASYTFTDETFTGTAFYRLTQTDNNGTLSIFNIVRLKTADQINNTLIVASHAGYNRLIFTNDGAPQRVQLKVVSLNGKTIYAANNFANTGTNVFTLPTTLGTGIVVASVLTADGKLSSKKALLHQ